MLNEHIACNQVTSYLLILNQAISLQSVCEKFGCTGHPNLSTWVKTLLKFCLLGRGNERNTQTNKQTNKNEQTKLTRKLSFSAGNSHLKVFLTFHIWSETFFLVTKYFKEHRAFTDFYRINLQSHLWHLQITELRRTPFYTDCILYTNIPWSFLTVEKNSGC